jgi:hypothetical protein
MPFAPGCEPMKLLAGLDVTAKAIERAAEAIGAEIAQRDQQEIGRAKQLVLPVVSRQNIPKMYVLMDGVQVPVVAAGTEGRTGRIEGQRAPHTRVQARLGAEAESGPRSSGPGRGRPLDLESGRPTLPHRHSNRGSVSCPTAFMENSRPPPPPRPSSEKTLDDSHEGAVG